MHIDGVDEIDKKILSLIEDDARLSYSEIAEDVGISRVSVKNRMKALEDKGIIKGYKTVINPTGSPEGIKFFMEIETVPVRFLDVIDFLAAQPENRQIYALSGDCRIQVTGYAKDAPALKDFADRVYDRIEGTRKFSLRQVMVTYKDVDGGVEYVDRRKLYQNEGTV